MKMSIPGIVQTPTSLLLLVVSWLLGTPLSADVPRNLRSAPVPNGLGLRLNEFALSWTAQGQESFQVLAASDERKLAADVGDLWDSGRRFTSRSEGIVCRGKAFPERAVVWWKVRVWNDRSEASAYSVPARIEVSAASTVVCRQAILISTSGRSKEKPAVSEMCPR